MLLVCIELIQLDLGQLPGARRHRLAMLVAPC